MPHLLSLPVEILEDIVVAASVASHLRPPQVLRSMLLSCRPIHDRLAADAIPRLYARVFAQHFDRSAPDARLADEWGLQAEDVTTELCLRFTALRVFRNRDINDPNLLSALRTAWIMVLEDEGRNIEQLHLAGAPSMVLDLLRRKLANTSAPHRLWPGADPVTSYAIALLWALTTEESLQNEREDVRDEVIELLAPFAFAGFKFQSSTAPEHLFASSMGDDSFRPPQPSRPAAEDIVYFGHQLRVQPPPAAPYAMLSYIARVEEIPLMVPDFIPRTRADAIALMGPVRIPTQDDIVEYNEHCRVRRAALTRRKSQEQVSDDSADHRFDADWARWFTHLGCTAATPPPHCAPANTYRLGSLTGSWRGTCLVPDRISYEEWANSQTMPDVFTVASRLPIYAEFQEHYCTCDMPRLPDAIDSHGFKDAWLPRDFSYSRREAEGEVDVKDGDSFKASYRTFDGTSFPPSRITDVIITGQTRDRHGLAWGQFKYAGRVRLSDGFVVLLRESEDPQMLARMIFKGYVLGNQNFVGRWTDVTTGADPSTWSAFFSLSRE